MSCAGEAWFWLPASRRKPGSIVAPACKVKMGPGVRRGNGDVK